MRTAGIRKLAGAALVGLLLTAGSNARAQDAGTVAALEGAAEAGVSGAARPLDIGATFRIGEPVRTATGARLQVLLADGSVLALGPESELEVTELQAAAAGAPRSRTRLQRGALRAVVDARGASGSFVVDTPTGLVTVRGTDFLIVVDPVADTSQVVGFGGQVAVHSVLDPNARGVIVTAGELTTVARRRYPTPPQKLSETVFRQYLDSLAFVGGGKPESLALADAVLGPAPAPPPDEISAAAQRAARSFGTRAVGSPPYPEALIDENFRNDSVVDVPSQAVSGEVGVEF